jgi:DNA-binding CsgD family transcriptional regulator
MNKFEFKSKDEELQFLRKVLNAIPALINVNQVDDLNDPSANFNLWSNQQVYDFTGYSRQEIEEMGFKFFLDTMHPDDMELIMDSLGKFTKSFSTIHGGLMRLKPKNGDYHWFIGNMAVMEMKDDKPWRVIVNVLNMEQMKDTQTQIIQLIKENLQLKNQLRIQTVTKREKQIIKLIAKGKTDREIAADLSISPATAKTHRHNIIQKLNLKNKAAIAQFAAEIGLD